MTPVLHALAVASFWGCALLAVYTYFLYPVILFVAYALAQIKRDWLYMNRRSDRRVRSTASDKDLPSVSILIPAYNEERCLPAKLFNTAQLTYPRKKLEVVFVSDGSTDRTNEILREPREAWIHTVILAERRGKANAINQAAQLANGQILVLSDASTLFQPDGVQKLIRHFSNGEVGVVCGSLEFVGSDESRATEGRYWQYESALRMMESRLGATLTASGAYYAIRKSCFRPLDATTLLDDFVTPMNVRKQGLRVVYDPEAVAKEFAAASVSGEFRRRVRLAIGSFRALPQLIQTPMPGFTLLAFVSHKVLRWIMPFLLIGLFTSSIFLSGTMIYGIALAGQCIFYFWAAMGMLFAQRRRRLPYGLACYFVCAMNLALLLGFFKALKSGTHGVWQRVS